MEGPAGGGGVGILITPDKVREKEYSGPDPPARAHLPVLDITA